MAYNTHGLSKSTTYSSWQHMKDRCLNPNHKAFREYGHRGIKICVRWFSFENFLEDMGERPAGLELDRKDSNGDYCKENCRWATKSVNQRNKREEELRALELKLQRMGYDLDQLDLDNPYTQFGEDIE